MKKENSEFLDAHRDALTQIQRAQTCVKANAIKSDLLRILQEEFMPGYVMREDCVSCLFSMVPLLYRRYDEWVASQSVPKQRDPINEEHIVAASFPKHEKTKNHKRK